MKKTIVQYVEDGEQNVFLLGEQSVFSVPDEDRENIYELFIADLVHSKLDNWRKEIQDKGSFDFLGVPFNREDFENKMPLVKKSIESIYRKLCPLLIDFKNVYFKKAMKLVEDYTDKNSEITDRGKCSIVKLWERTYGMLFLSTNRESCHISIQTKETYDLFENAVLCIVNIDLINRTKKEMPILDSIIKIHVKQFGVNNIYNVLNSFKATLEIRILELSNTDKKKPVNHLKMGKKYIKIKLEELDNSIKGLTQNSIAINQDNRGSQQGNGFSLGKSEAYLKALYKALVDAEFLAPSTKESHFVNAFNGKPLATDFEPLVWADKSKTRNQSNAQTLYEFLYLLNFDKTIYQTDATNSDNFYRKIERVFQLIANLPVKNPTKVTQRTPRHKELKTIIDNLN